MLWQADPAGAGPRLPTSQAETHMGLNQQELSLEQERKKNKKKGLKDNS